MLTGRGGCGSQESAASRYRDICCFRKCDRFCSWRPVGRPTQSLHLLAMAREAGVELSIDDFRGTARAHAAACRSETGGSICRR